MQVRLARAADDDRLVVDCDDLAFGAALEDLYFRRESDGYAKHFARESVSEAIVGRFERALLPLLRQTARIDATPWEPALHDVARRLERAGVDWWLAGSAALAARGIAVSPRDLDLVVAGDDADRVATAFGDSLIEPAAEVEGWFCRWFGRAWLGARVEWVAGVTQAADQPEPTDFGLVAASALSEISWQGWSLRVPPIGLQREVSRRRGLAERVALIDAFRDSGSGVSA